MDFTELCSEVYTLTNRPDLINETQSAVRAATLRAHHLDYFPKDLYENYYAFDSADYYQQMPLSLIPNYRALKYIRKYYPGTSLANPPDQNPQNLPPLFPFYNPGANLPDGFFFKIIDPKQVLDSYGINKVDVAYLAGQTLQLRSGDQVQYVLLGAYVHPDITLTGFNSWIATENPYAIVYDAAAIVFKTIGYDEQYSAYDEMKKMEWTQLQTGNILTEGG